jgi:asparagine synthase (glutamine-hydrolysing)
MDICTMAHGLEARAPLLDHTLIEFMAGLPGKLKVQGRSLKHLLKETQKAVFPAEHLQRPKQGFSIPIGRWFRGPLNGWLRENLLAADASIHRLIRREKLEKLIAQHESGAKDYGHHLWALLMLELWLKRFLSEQRVEPAAVEAHV